MTMIMTTPNDQYGFRYRNWDVYQDAREFRKYISELLKRYPRKEQYALTDQTKRALNSILLNLAEGANRTTSKDTRIFINRAHTSLDEVVACIDCALDDAYITPQQHEEVLRRAESLAKRLRGFANHLLSSSS